jgi:hypothetical protein
MNFKVIICLTSQAFNLLQLIEVKLGFDNVLVMGYLHINII